MSSGFEDAYLREIVIQGQYALMSVQAMNAILEAKGSAVAFFREAQSFLNQAAAMSRILWPPKTHTPTAVARAEHLRKVLEVTESHPLRRRTLRDHLEHFDERLDRWSQETTHGTIIDLTIGPATQFVGGEAVSRGDFLRVYEPERKVFTFRGDEFDIQELVGGVEHLMTAASKRADDLGAAAVQQGAAADAAPPRR